MSLPAVQLMDNEQRSDEIVGYDPTIRLLIIDDDLHVLAVLEDLFTGEPNVKATAMSNSGEAIKLLNTARFDMVITDLMMPGPNGLAVARAVQKTMPEALVIIITGYASLETTLEAIRLGVYDYITKPFQVDEFKLLVNNASMRIRLERQVKYLKSELEKSERKSIALQKAYDKQAVNLDTMKQEFRRLEGFGVESATARSIPAPSGAGKIGAYEKMAGDMRVRLMHMREQSGKEINSLGQQEDK